jgi:pyrroline-5-carboxylate reductase
MDAVTAVSGSGPAYVFYFMEALQEAARELGLGADEARRLSLQNFQRRGAARRAQRR